LRVPLSVLTFCVLIACDRADVLSDINVPPCVYLSNTARQHFSLGYAGQMCERAGYQPLPTSEFDAVSKWAINAQSAEFLPPIAQFRIVARLASQDSRSDWGFSFHGDWFWRTYKWGDWTSQADLISIEALKNDSLINALLESPLSRATLAHGHGLDMTVRKTRLSRSVQKQLKSIFAGAELRLQTMPGMLRAPRTVEEAIQSRPDFAIERRRTFTEYAID
jgi:hypothetical protein